MRFYLISDNEDTLVGMRLAGIDGVMVSNETDALQELNKAMKRVQRCGSFDYPKCCRHDSGSCL